MNTELKDIINAYTDIIASLKIEIQELKNMHNSTVDFYENELDLLYSRLNDYKTKANKLIIAEESGVNYNE